MVEIQLVCIQCRAVVAHQVVERTKDKWIVQCCNCKRRQNFKPFRKGGRG